jgi:hypothetical protein
VGGAENEQSRLARKELQEYPGRLTMLDRNIEGEALGPRDRFPSPGKDVGLQFLELSQGMRRGSARDSAANSGPSTWSSSLIIQRVPRGEGPATSVAATVPPISAAASSSGPTVGSMRTSMVPPQANPTSQAVSSDTEKRIRRSVSR